MKRNSLCGLYSPELLESRIAPAVFIVTSIADTGAGSLRQAVLDSNGTPDVTDTITFKLPVDSKITLPTGIEITDSVKIVGPGAGKLSISGTDSFSIFVIRGSTPVLETVSISGVTLMRGYADYDSDGGGAIYCTETLALDKVNIIDSRADGNGGGVYVSTEGSFTMKNSTVTNCTAEDQTGGVWVRAGKGIQVVSCKFVNNDGSGGALYAAVDASAPKADIVIDKSLFSGNIGGTAVVLKNDNLGLDTVNNSKDDGAIKVTNSIVTGNFGRGIAFGAGNVTVQKTTVSNNTTGGAGAGINAFNSDSLTIKTSTISNNATTDASATGGAGLFVSGSFVTSIQGSVFSANDSKSGGGAIFARDGADLRIASTLFSDNTAQADGGAIYAVPDTGADVALDVKTSKFLDNISAAGGGAISTAGGGILAVTGSLFSGNDASVGGAIKVIGSGVAKISGGTFSGNIAAGSAGGGAVYSSTTGSIEILAGLFVNNAATTGGGGAFALASFGSKTVKTAKILNNYAKGAGGGILITSFGATNIIGSTISGNISSLAGGGISNSSTPAIITSSKIVDNAAPTFPQVNP